MTGRPWHALRTPDMTFSRLNGSITPDRLMTFRLAVSIVEKRPPHSGHWRRRRMLRPSSLVRESMTRESGWRQNGQCMAATDYALSDRRSASKRASTASPCAGSVLGLGERDDRVAHLRERRAVVLDDLLRPQERRRRQPGRVARLPAGRQHVVAAGEVVAEAHRRVRADEHRHRRGRTSSGRGVGEVQLEVLGRVGVAERGRGREVVDEHDRRLRARQGDRDALGVTRARRARRDSAATAAGERLGVGHEHGRRLLVVLGLADQIGGDETRVGRVVGDDEDLGRAGLGIRSRPRPRRRAWRRRRSCCPDR